MTTKFKVLAAALGLALSAMSASAQLTVISGLTSSTNTTFSGNAGSVTFFGGGSNVNSTSANTSQSLVSGDVVIGTFSGNSAGGNASSFTNIYTFTTTLTSVIPGSLVPSPLVIVTTVQADTTLVNNVLTTQFSITSPTNGAFVYTGPGSTPPFTYTYTVSLDSLISTDTFTGVNDGLAYSNRLFIAITPPIFQAVPEPSTYALIGAAALVGLVAVRRFRKNKAA